MDMGIGESRVCLGISRVLIDGRFEIGNRCLNVLLSVLVFARKFGKAGQTASQYGAAAKIIGVSLGVHRSSAGRLSAVLWLSLAKIKNTSKINNIRRGCVTCYIMDDVQTTRGFGE